MIRSVFTNARENERTDRNMLRTAVASIARRRGGTTVGVTARAFASTSSTASTSSPGGRDGDGRREIPMNALATDIQGKVISTRIVAVDRRNGVAHATTGLRAPTTYRLDELHENVAVGDVVEARVTWMNNPLRELDLEVKGLAASKRKERAWRELLEARDAGKAVRGRILNAVNGGYAVGIAGLIAFLPARAYRGKGEPRTAEKALRDALENGGGSGSDVGAPIVGDLLTFKILKMTASGETYRNVVVTGPIGGNSGERRRVASAKEVRARAWKPRSGKGKATAAEVDGESESESESENEDSAENEEDVESDQEAEEKP